MIDDVDVLEQLELMEEHWQVLTFSTEHGCGIRRCGPAPGARLEGGYCGPDTC